MLSVPGQLVLLRERFGRNVEEIEAVRITDSDLRSVVFAQWRLHSMQSYKLRVSMLAMKNM